jgi:hypothetical protein
MSEILSPEQTDIWKRYVSKKFKWGIDYSDFLIQSWEENNKPKSIWKQK